MKNVHTCQYISKGGSECDMTGLLKTLFSSKHARLRNGSKCAEVAGLKWVQFGNRQSSWSSTRTCAQFLHLIKGLQGKHRSVWHKVVFRCESLQPAVGAVRRLRFPPTNCLSTRNLMRSEWSRRGKWKAFWCAYICMRILDSKSCPISTLPGLRFKQDAHAKPKEQR